MSRMPTPNAPKTFTRDGELVSPVEARRRREAAEAHAAGHLRCYSCGGQFDPNASEINGTRVAASMHCNRCQQLFFDQGRWQERFRYECAVQPQPNARERGC